VPEGLGPAGAGTASASGASSLPAQPSLDEGIADEDDRLRSAFTVEVRPGDNLMFHVALAVARHGDVGPGDLIVGDVDGVVVIPREDVEEVLLAAEKKVAAERQQLREIADGLLVSSGLDDALRQAGLAPLPPAGPNRIVERP
jgi:hypothetical protein